MDIQKAKRLLAKINVLVDNHDEEYSTLENDLLKTYIKELYECVSDTVKSRKQIQDNAQEKVEEKPKPFKEAPIPEVPEVAPVPLITNDNSMQDKIADLKVEEEPREDVVSSHQKDEVVVESEMAENGMQDQQSTSTRTDSELEALFSFQQENDLSSRLASKPVTLIENAMGINERIFTINELFRGDRELFQQTVDTINRSESYDQAKEFLMTGIASELEWSSENNAEKATAFIRLIHRKFSHV
jgi:hypothetical protein